MALDNIVARTEEIRRLQDALQENKAQLIVLYGRRRVGKTWLITEYFDNQFDFKMTGSYKEKKDVQLQNFAEALCFQTNKAIEQPKNWTAAFWQLRRYLSDLPKEEKHVVFFDEMPWLDTPRSGFLSAFEHFWNDFGCTMHNLVFIVCGSATSWISKHIEKNRGGLFRRQTCSIYLKPFTLGETEEYLKSRGIQWSRYDIAECYMILGGIPFYLSLLNRNRSLTDNIDSLLFKKRAELWNEFHQLYHTLFTNSDQYIRIVEELSKKRVGLTRQELLQRLKIADNGKMTEMLKNLENSGFVRVETFFGKQKKGLHYQLCDYFTMFYFRFLNKPGRDEHFWTHFYGSNEKRTWAGLTFEQVCKDHIPQIKWKMSIGGILSEEYTWETKGDEDTPGAQIDLLIDRKDHVINLCEIKYAEDQFTINKEYEASLRSKMEVFRNNTQTKKTIQIVMITTYGIKENKYSNMISNQILLDDLYYTEGV